MRLSDRLVLFLARGFGAGLVPRAPGTVGSLLGIPLGLALITSGWSLATQIAILGLFIVFACAIAHRAESLLPGHDSGEIVIDEVAGMAVAMLGHGTDPLDVLSLFLLFRFADIVKLWPARTIDRRVPGGLGVVLDDVVAGLYANILARGIGIAG